jgi:carbonic anhydrase
MISATEALDRLRAGNRRFASDLATHELRTRSEHRNALVGGQEPFAIILGCSDSRVPAEIVFDQGLGDLFVIRVAGNIVAPSQIGSIEFAAEQFGAKLVVVLGHSNCGAISATIEQLRRTAESRSPNLRAIVDRVRPSIDELMSREPKLAGDDLARKAVLANICASVEQLRHGSQILEALVADGDLLIVGAEYSLETGLVHFFDDMPKET